MTAFGGQRLVFGAKLQQRVRTPKVLGVENRL